MARYAQDLDNESLYAETVRLVRAANFPDAVPFAQTIIDRFVNRCEELHIPLPHYHLTIQMAGAVAGLYATERLNDVPPNPAPYGKYAEIAAVGEIRDLLLVHRHKAVQPTVTLDIFSNVAIACLCSIARQLPALAQFDPNVGLISNEVPTVPLVDILPNIGQVIESAIAPFTSPEARDSGLFRRFRQRLQHNNDEIAKRARSKHPISPIDYDGAPAETVHVYLQNTPLEHVFDARIPFDLPDEQRFSGHWIIAPPGRGKTTLLHSMFLDDVQRDASIIVMDSKGDLINPIKELAAVKDRLLLIEPDPDYSLALNPLDIPNTNIAHTVSLLEYVFSALLEAKMTALQMTLFRSVLPALVEVVPNATLETFRDVIENGIGRYRQYIEKLSPDLKDFLTRQFDTKTYTETRQQLVWRLQFLMTNPIIKQMFSALKTKLDIGKEMDAGKIILIDNGKQRLGDEGSEFFGRFFIALVLAAAQQRAGRPHSQKKPCYFYIDECQTVIRRDEKISTILDECRSQKIAMVMAHQRTAQITSANVLDALSNCAIRMANSDDEAKYLADKLRMDADTLRSLPRGTFATYVRDLTQTGLALKIPYVDLAALPKLTAAEQRAIRDRTRAQFSFAPQSRGASTVALPQPDNSSAEPPVQRSSPSPSDPHAGGHTQPATKW